MQFNTPNLPSRVNAALLRLSDNKAGQSHSQADDSPSADPAQRNKNLASKMPFGGEKGGSDFQVGRQYQSLPSTLSAKSNGEPVSDMKSLFQSAVDTLRQSIDSDRSHDGSSPTYRSDRSQSSPPSPDYGADRSQPSTRSSYSSADSGKDESSVSEPSRSIPNAGSHGGGSQGGGAGISSSLMDSRIDGGTGYNDHGWDYGPQSADDGTSTQQWYSDETYGTASAAVGAQAESYSGDGSYGAAVNVGAGAKASAGYSDAEGNHVVGYASGSVSAGGRVSTDYNEETGLRSSTAGAGAGATAHAGVAYGNADSSSSVGGAVSADYAAEASVVTADGVPVGVAGNVGGDLGVEGELTHTRTTDVGTSSSTVTGGADVGVGAGGELGMRSDGTFAVAAEADIGPVGIGFSMEVDTNVVKDRGNAIDSYWNSGDKTEAVTQTADLVLDVAETVPGLGSAVGAFRDVGYGVEKAYNEFAEGDVLGGLEALGDGWLDGVENLPFVGSAVSNVRDWVTDGGIKDVANEVVDAAHVVADFSGDALGEVADFSVDALGEVADFSADVIDDVADSLDAAKDVVEDVGKGIKDVARKGKEALDDIGDGAKDVVDDIGDGIKDTGNAIKDGLSSLNPF